MLDVFRCPVTEHCSTIQKAGKRISESLHPATASNLTHPRTPFLSFETRRRYLEVARRQADIESETARLEREINAAEERIRNETKRLTEAEQQVRLAAPCRKPIKA